MRLVIQIPALNEAMTIAKVIQAIPSPIEGITECIVVVVDDGSTDGTGDLARAAGAIVVRHDTPRDVGGAFKSGIRKSEEIGADIVVTIDADGQFNPADIPTLILPIVRKEADFVTASRFSDPAKAPDMPLAKRFGNDLIARWLSHLMKQRYYDVSCGFRAYSKEAYFRLILTGEFTYTHETFLALAFSGMRIQEIPLTIRGQREFGTSRVASNLFRYGYQAALIILKTYRDYRPLRFFGAIAGFFLMISMVLMGFLGYHHYMTGDFTPYKWVGVTALTCFDLATLVFVLALLAEMSDRSRVIQMEVLTRLRLLEQKTMTNPSRSY